MPPIYSNTRMNFITQVVTNIKADHAYTFMYSTVMGVVIFLGLDSVFLDRLITFFLACGTGLFVGFFSSVGKELHILSKTHWKKIKTKWKK